MNEVSRGEERGGKEREDAHEGIREGKWLIAITTICVAR
jgi:hypothetical protein